MLNMYEYEIVLPDGRKSRDEGVTIMVFAPDIETARQKVLYQNRKNKWKGTPHLIDVKLDQSAFNPKHGVVPNEPTTTWYMNYTPLKGHFPAMRVRLQ